MKNSYETMTSVTCFALQRAPADGTPAGKALSLVFARTSATRERCCRRDIDEPYGALTRYSDVVFASTEWRNGAGIGDDDMSMIGTKAPFAADDSSTGALTARAFPSSGARPGAIRVLFISQSGTLAGWDVAPSF